MTLALPLQLNFSTGEKRREEEGEAEWKSWVGDRNTQSERKKQSVGGNKGKKQVWEKKKTSLLTFCTNINKQLHKREKEKGRKVCIKRKKKKRDKRKWLKKLDRQTKATAEYLSSVDTDLFTTCGIIILKRTVVLLSFWHLVFGFTLSAWACRALWVVRACWSSWFSLFTSCWCCFSRHCLSFWSSATSYTHKHSDLKQVQETELHVFFSFSTCRSDPLMLFLQLPCPLLVLQPTAFCILSLALELLLKLFQSMLGTWCLSLTKKRVFRCICLNRILCMVTYFTYFYLGNTFY